MGQGLKERHLCAFSRHAYAVFSFIPSNLSGLIVNFLRACLEIYILVLDPYLACAVWEFRISLWKLRDVYSHSDRCGEWVLSIQRSCLVAPFCVESYF